jgi:hypothetical protein
MKINLRFLLIPFLTLHLVASGQMAVFKGEVVGFNGAPMLGSSIIATNKNIGTVASSDGSFKMNLPANQKCFIKVSFLGYQSVFDTIVATPDEVIIKKYTLNKKVSEIEGVTLIGIQPRDKTLTRINMKSIDQLPNTSGNIEAILKSFSGVVSGNELSSQYSVRGGSYDENLVYVNDIEIHRPLLVQSAMQEGLSFVNPNMVSGIQFSAGGFDAEYGDKMSSVLDITYKKPTEFEGTVIASLLGGSVHLAGVSKDKKLNFNTGFRYKTSQYLLSSLDVKGEFVPNFSDLQGLVTYNFTQKSSLSILGNYSANRFNMAPETRETDFGTIQKTLRLTVFYDGQEKDMFDSYMGAISFNHSPNRNLSLKFIGSAFQSNEEISYDILSEYYLSQIARSSGSKDTVINIGTGASLEHARKYLNSSIISLEHKGTYFGDNISWKWGLKAQTEYIDDKFNEWRFLDSTGMSVPYSDEEILLDYSERAHNKISSFRYQAFIQNSQSFYTENAQYGLTYGLRANYWTYNNNLLISPRATITVKPYWERRVEFMLATGLYGQPPLYKEVKKYSGDLFPERRAQKSLHFVFGTDYYYTMWDRPFIFTTEIYFKHLYDIIPYRVKNIQVEYMPEYEAKGFATGIDFRVYGEFVPGTESWFSLSLLRTREKVTDMLDSENVGASPTTTDYYRRPTDQTLTFSIFFQDYLPSNPDYKVHLLVNFGTGLPYSGPTSNKPGEVFLLNQYKRVDIGFSRIIKRQKNKKVGLNNIWITAEILNLLKAPNMASYDWVKTVENNVGVQDMYAVPNYLTGRRFNIKVSTKL